MSNSQNSIPNFNSEIPTVDPMDELESPPIFNPVDLLLGALFLVSGYYLFHWNPKFNMSQHVENVDAIPKIKEVATLMYFGLFTSWFYKRFFSK